MGLAQDAGKHAEPAPRLRALTGRSTPQLGLLAVPRPRSRRVHPVAAAEIAKVRACR